MRFAADDQPSVLVTHARVVSGGAVADDHWVLLGRRTVLATGGGPLPPVPGVPRVDAKGQWATPGFIDLHCHGAGGFAYDSGADAIARARAVHRARGTTRSAVSLVTASIPELCTSLERISGLCESDPTLLGAHLEGPFLADAHRGAHDPGLLTAPTPAAVDRLIEAGAGRIAQITIAPELVGGLDAVRRFQRAGVVVAVGHTAADYETAAAAFDAGASVLTHAFNAMDDVRHRQPGPLPAAVERGWVTLELIADGVHVADPVMRLLLDAVPTRTALITDAMEATGMPDGDYLLGALPVVVTDGVARLRAGGAIAGSTLTLDRAFRRAVQRLRVPIAEAAGMLTEIPARTLGLDDRLGRLDPGFAADLLLFDPDLQLVRGWADGAEIPGIGR